MRFIFIQRSFQAPASPTNGGVTLDYEMARAVFNCLEGYILQAAQQSKFFKQSDENYTLDSKQQG